MQEEWISVYDYARFIGKTTQQVYNLLRSGMVVGMEFHRGSMRGWLVQKPAGFDMWAQQEAEKENYK